ncbi:mitochondrial coenzyme A transporter [Coccidioides immitis RMSCC 3703]|uniref:Mitochondrial coenzyme A transporter n=1 Tax=Coccidioides immitis RMSCC 3703 TaxID=454286 RepID=A0A0J8R129_COCIT|nr:mitochondrial coenzyme A transporter [Coccidioides immitis RMSCC 3703]
MGVKSINVPKSKESSTAIEGTHHVSCTSTSNKDSQNLDFIIRNGLAGGAAGCAVSLTTLATKS